MRAISSKQKQKRGCSTAGVNSLFFCVDAKVCVALRLPPWGKAKTRRATDGAFRCVQILCQPGRGRRLDDPFCRGRGGRPMVAPTVCTPFAPTCRDRRLFGFPWGKLSPEATDEGLMEAKHRTMLCRLPACPHPSRFACHLPHRGRLGYSRFYTSMMTGRIIGLRCVF